MIASDIGLVVCNGVTVCVDTKRVTAELSDRLGREVRYDWVRLFVSATLQALARGGTVAEIIAGCGLFSERPSDERELFRVLLPMERLDFGVASDAAAAMDGEYDLAAEKRFAVARSKHFATAADVSDIDGEARLAARIRDALTARDLDRARDSLSRALDERSANPGDGG